MYCLPTIKWQSGWMNRVIVLSLSLCLFSLNLLQAQDSTLIPDPNFEQALIDLGIDTDGEINGRVLTNEINSITDLNVFNYEIDNLTGIEDFDSLETLNCSRNRLKTINVTSNAFLRELNCSSNQLESLDVSNNSLLQKTGFYLQSNLCYRSFSQ